MILLIAYAIISERTRQESYYIDIIVFMLFVMLQIASVMLRNIINERSIMFTSKRDLTKALSQASPNNIVGFKLTVAIRNPQHLMFSAVVFKDAQYRIMRYDYGKSSWELKHIAGDGPEMIMMPASVFDEYVEVLSQN